MPSLTDEELDDAVRKELAPGEEVVWKGRPSPLRLALGYWVVPVFGVSINVPGARMLWSGFSDLLSGRIDEGFGHLAIGIILSSIGTLAIAWPFRLYSSAGRTTYAVTTDRIIEGAFGTHVRIRSVAISDVASLMRFEAADGVGKILMQLKPNCKSDGSPYPESFELRAVPGVRFAEESIRRVMAGKSGT